MQRASKTIVGVITARAECEAAWIRVRDLLLDTKRRGDKIAYSEVQIIAGPNFDARRLYPRIRKYIKDKFGDWDTEIGDGWLIPTDLQAMNGCLPSRIEKEKRATENVKQCAMGGAVGIDESKITPELARYRALAIQHTSNAIAAQIEFNRKRKVILGAPPPRPRLEPARSDERKANGSEDE